MKPRTPKATEVIALWRQYPRQIEASIRAEYPGAHIKQWHQGEMSSRELLTLLMGLTAESWFKTTLTADLRRMAAEAEKAELDRAHERSRAMLRGELDVGPFEIDVVEKRRPSQQESAEFGRARQYGPPTLHSGGVEETDPQLQESR